MSTTTPTNTPPGCSYKIMPVTIKNRIPAEVKKNPRELASIIQELKPEAKLRGIRVMPSGDLQITGATPHDYNLLRQGWPNHALYGHLTPMLPEERCVDQSVLVLGLPTSITEEEVREHLFEENLHPKKVERFNRKGTQEKSTTVKITFSSSQQKAKLLQDGLLMYYQLFRVVDYQQDPEIQQCFRCQGFNHQHWGCDAAQQKCLRCSGNHRVRDCPHDRANPLCANCGGAHIANYRGCPAFKEAVKAERERRNNSNNNNNNSNNNSNNNNNNNNNNGPTTEKGKSSSFFLFSFVEIKLWLNVAGFVICDCGNFVHPICQFSC